jgi:hypothetical protein
MKQPDFLKNIPALARMLLLRPMLMISFVLHGVVLLLPIPSDLDKSKLPKKEEQVKITRLQVTRPSPKPSPQSSSQPNPQPTSQPSQPAPSNLPDPLQSLWQPNLQPTPQLNQSALPNLPASSPPITTRQQSPELSVPIREPSSQLQQQFKPQETQQQPAEQPKRSLSIQEPTQSPQPNQEQAQSPSAEQPTQSPPPNQEQARSPSAKQPTQSPQPNQEPTQSPSVKQPTQSPPPNPEPTEKNGSIPGGYSEFFNKNQNDIMLRAALAEVKQGGQNKLQDFKTERDLDKLTESDKFKDASGQPGTQFQFLKKAVSPLTTQDITAALETQLSSLEFRFEKKGTYGGGPLYEVTKDDFKRYVILAPGKDEQGSMTAIIVSQDYPG